MGQTLRSMTGFGSCCLEQDGVQAKVDIKCLNQRGLRLSLRSQPPLGIREKEMRDLLSQQLRRGNIEVFLTLNRLTPQPEAILNTSLAVASLQAMRKFASEQGIKDTIEIKDILLVPDIFYPSESNAISDPDFTLLQRALKKALRQVIEMREAEGIATSEVLLQHLGQLDKFRRFTEERAPQIVANMRERLQTKLADLREGLPAEPDSAALEREVMFFADKADVCEEASRLKSHLQQFKTACKNGRDAGKRLEFLIQELLREVNTIASKGNDTQLTSEAVEAKLAIEKLREQVANIE